MARIKKIKMAGWRKVIKGDVADKAFWNEFSRREEISAKKVLMGVEELGQGKPVTITVRDEETGQEWVIEGVKVMREKDKKYKD